METQLKRMETLSRRAADRLARLGAFALAIMMLLTFADVIGRYFFDAPIVGTVEITELLMGLIIYTGVGMTTFARGHIQVDIVVGYLSPRRRAIADLLALSVTIAFSLLIFWQLCIKAIDTFSVNDQTQVWFLPVWPVSFTMAFCSLFVTIGMFFFLMEAILILVQKPEK